MIVVFWKDEFVDKILKIFMMSIILLLVVIVKGVMSNNFLFVELILNIFWLFFCDIV